MFPRFIDDRIRSFLERRGYIYLKGQDSMALGRRRRLLEARGTDLVLDIGANTGQYGVTMRRLGYRGRMVSFEPMNAAFARLAQTLAADPAWQARPHGLGDQHAEMTLNISENSISSSMLEMLPAHVEAAPGSRYVANQTVRVVPLDDLFPELRGDARSIWMKLDVQGFEDRVLRGARESLGSVDVVQMELSFVPLYRDQQTFLATCRMLEECGFIMSGLEPGFFDQRTGVLLQADGIFVRRG